MNVIRDRECSRFSDPNWCEPELSGRTITPHVDVRWWLLSQFDSALVSAADGASAAWYQRDPAKFRDLMMRSMTIHARLYKEWPELVETYKEAYAELASPDTWRKTFDNSNAEG